MKRNGLHLRLRTRLALVMLLVMGCTSAIMTATYVYHSNMVRAYVEAQTSELVAISNLAQQRIRPGVSRNEALEDYKRFLEDAGLTSITVVAPSGEVVASTNPSQLGKKIKIKKRSTNASPDPIKISAEFRDIDMDTGTEQKTLMVDFPIVQGDKVIGYAEVRAESDQVGELLRHYYRERLIWILVTLLAGMMAMVYLATRFTRPIDQLVTSVTEVARGNLDVVLPASGSDEIGRLSQTFNQMVERLRENRRLQERLNQAEKESLAGRLAATVAHEVRNSLNFINLSIDQVRARQAHAASEDRAAQELQRNLCNVKEEIIRLNRLVNDFLAAGRKSPPELTPCDIGEIVRASLALIEKQAAAQGVRIETDLPPDLPALGADAGLLKTCFVNILTNALQAMPSGGQLRISATLSGVPDVLRLRFADSGPGIPRECREKVFEPYYSTRATGFGLGLAITRKIIEDHAGRVFVEDGNAPGATIAVEIPLARTSQVPAAERVQTPVA
jgi:nitrogen fixation/metabolism regulation signal transduction histidine kinase